MVTCSNKALQLGPSKNNFLFFPIDKVCTSPYASSTGMCVYIYAAACHYLPLPIPN